MIISVSGRIGHGKDTVGDIVRLLTRNVKGDTFDTSHWKVEDVINTLNGSWNPTHDKRIYTFETRKFADKLKDIVCMLIGCTRAQLEDRNFKEKELGEEWWYWKVFSSISQDKFELIPYNKENVFYDRKPNYKGHLLKKLTPRLILQILGTEAGRGLIHPNLWVNSLMSEYKDEHDLSTWGHEAKYPNWVVTDMRFPNEMEAVKKRGGVTIRVNRNSVYKDSDTQFSHDIPHPSETALDDAKFDYIIDNSGSIEELIEKVKEILIKENLL